MQVEVKEIFGEKSNVLPSPGASGKFHGLGTARQAVDTQSDSAASHGAMIMGPYFPFVFVIFIIAAALGIILIGRNCLPVLSLLKARISRFYRLCVATLLAGTLLLGSESAKQWAAGVLGKLAALSEDWREQIIKAGAQKPLVMLLKEGSEGGKEEAEHALGNLSENSEERSSLIFKAGVLQPLVMLLRDGLEEAKADAAYALGKLALNSKVRSAQIAKAGAVEPLVLLLKEGSEKAKLDAVHTLRNLAAKSKERSMQIVSAGALHPLVMLLKEGSEKAKLDAVHTLRNLAAYSEQRSVQIAKEGALQPLVLLLKSGSEDAKAVAASMLEQLGKFEASWAHILDAGALQPLVEMLGEGSTLHQAATSALSILTGKDAEDIEAVGSSENKFSSLQIYLSGNAMQDDGGAQSTNEGEVGPSSETTTTTPPEQGDSLFPPDVHKRYLELSRRPKATACSCCGAEAAENGGKKLQVCSKCHRKAYCSPTCQRQDWKEGGHKRSCRPQKDFRKHDVVVAQGIEGKPELNGQLMVVVGPAASEGRWLVLDERRNMSLHADKLRLVVPVEERDD